MLFVCVPWTDAWHVLMQVAPVSQKVHTTRCKTLGVLTEDKKQVVCNISVCIWSIKCVCFLRVCVPGAGKINLQLKKGS